MKMKFVLLENGQRMNAILYRDRRHGVLVPLFSSQMDQVARFGLQASHCTQTAALARQNPVQNRGESCRLRPNFHDGKSYVVDLCQGLVRVTFPRVKISSLLESFNENVPVLLLKSCS